MQTVSKLAELEKDNEQIHFATMKIKALNKETFNKYDITSKNEVHLYINQHRKKYEGEYTAKLIYGWIKEILEATPKEYQYYSKLPSIDKHYFLYVQKSHLTTH